MNLTDFSLLGEDNNNYTIGHPKGKSIVVPKKGMSEVAQKMISKLKREQHFDGGTPEGTEQAPAQEQDQAIEQVPEDSSTADAGEIPTNPEPNRAPAWDVMSDEKPNFAAATAQATGQPIPQPKTLDQAYSDTAADLPGQAQPAPGNTAPTDPFDNTHLEHGVKAAKALAVAEKGAADSNNAAQFNVLHGDEMAPGGPVPGLYQIAHDYAANNEALQKKSKNLQDAVANGSVDPNRYYHNMDTGSKIAAAIGMVISGLGSGITGQPNLAARMIEKSVDDDIKSQMNDQTNKQTLWKMNQDAIGNNHQAYLDATNQALAMASAKLAKNASSVDSHTAAIRVLPVIDDINKRIADNNQKRAIFDTINQPRPSGGLIPIDPATLVNHLVPPAARAAATQEIANRANTLIEKKKFMTLFDQADKEMAATSRTGRAGFVPPQIHAMEGMLLSLLRDKSGQVTDYELNIGKNNFPSAFTTPETSAVKRRFFSDLYDSKMAAPVSKSYGLDLDKFKSTSLKPEFAPGTPVNSRKTGKKYTVGNDGRTLHPR